MNITELRIANVKRIRAVSIAPDGNEPILITGNNAQGKSSILDAIFLALQNKGLADPIRHGSSKASIKLKLHGQDVEYVVERNITKKTNTLRVMAKEGEVKSPQAFLDSLIGNLAFDPLEFMRAKPKAQAEMIRNLVGVDTRALDAEYAQTFATRTEANRALDTAKVQFAALTKPEVPAEVTEQEVSAAELVTRHEAISEKQQALDTASLAVTNAQRAVSHLSARMADVRKQLDDMAKELVTLEAGYTKAEASLKEANAARAAAGSLEEVTAKIKGLDATNAAIRARRADRDKAQAALQTYVSKGHAVTVAMNRSEDLTRKLEDINEKRATMTRDAKMPVEGMAFDDDGVFVKNVRLDQMSTAEQVSISTSVAMQGNPGLRIILIREGALLNKETLKAICDRAKEKDTQVFIEKFQEEPGETGLHIIDGAVSHIDGQPVEVEPEKATEPQPEPATPSDSLL